VIVVKKTRQQRSLYTRQVGHCSVLITRFLSAFESHINRLVIHFGNLEPVVHLMHSALMVMFQMLIMSPCFAVFGRETTQPYCAENPDFFAVPTVEVQEVVENGGQAPGQCVYTQRARSPCTPIGRINGRFTTSWIGFGILYSRLMSSGSSVSLMRRSSAGFEVWSW